MNSRTRNVRKTSQRGIRNPNAGISAKSRTPIPQTRSTSHKRYCKRGDQIEGEIYWSPEIENVVNVENFVVVVVVVVVVVKTKIPEDQSSSSHKASAIQPPLCDMLPKDIDQPAQGLLRSSSSSSCCCCCWRWRCSLLWWGCTCLRRRLVTRPFPLQISPPGLPPWDCSGNLRWIWRGVCFVSMLASKTKSENVTTLAPFLVLWNLYQSAAPPAVMWLSDRQLVFTPVPCQVTNCALPGCRIGSGCFVCKVCFIQELRVFIGQWPHQLVLRRPKTDVPSVIMGTSQWGWASQQLSCCGDAPARLGLPGRGYTGFIPEVSTGDPGFQNPGIPPMDPWLRRTGDFYPNTKNARVVVTKSRVADTRVDKQEDTSGNRFQVQGTIQSLNGMQSESLFPARQ